MSTISERATASIKPIDYPRDGMDRDRLREEWRLSAMAWAHAKDTSERLDEGRKMLLDRMTLELRAGGMPEAKARMTARTSDQFKGFLERMHQAKRAASDAWIAMQNADRIYWAHVGQEATDRAERRNIR